MLDGPCPKSSIIVSSALVAVFTGPASGAEFFEVSDRPIPQSEIQDGDCTHMMRGEITAGDAERLQAIIAKLGQQDNDDNNFIICMNSLGGNLEEGIRIGRIIHENFFGTYVPKNSSCFSACAVAFMFGRVGFWEFAVTYRKMHVTARLGFHAPSLPIESVGGGMVPLRMVNNAYESAIVSLSKILEATSQEVSAFSSPIMPSSLISEMLQKFGPNYVEVKTLHDAFRWDIRISNKDFAFPRNFDMETAEYQLCANTSYKFEPQSHNSTPPIPVSINRAYDLTFIVGFEGKSNLNISAPPDHKVLQYFDYYNRQCSISFNAESKSFEVIRYVDGNFEDRDYFSQAFLLAPATEISTLAAR